MKECIYTKQEILLPCDLECKQCRCLFEVEYEDFDIELVGDHTEWYINCPECGDHMHVNPTKLVFGQVEY